MAAPAYYEQIVASLTSGVIALDRDGIIVTSNDAARTHLGLPEDRLRPGTRLEDAGAGVESFMEAVRQVMAEQKPVSRHQVTLPADAGREKVIGLSASLLQGPDSFNGAIFLFTDLTEMRRLEHEAELNRQLAQIGELTAGIVHELRNPLSVIAGSADLLIRKLGPEDQHRRAVDMIVAEAKQLDQAISRLLGFAKPFTLDIKEWAVEDILGRTERLSARRATTKDVQLTFGAAGVPVIMVDGDRVAEALANLVDNAIDATGEGGHVAVQARLDGDKVVFAVSDDGPGLTLKPGDDPFRPFFTMKEDGTGLGLSIVKRIAAAHKGNVAYGNRPEGGACFEIHLPVGP